MNNKILWGIDLGGTKIEGAVIKKSSPFEVLARLRVPTEAHLGYHHIVSQIEKLVNLLQAETGLTPDHIGIATPGTIDPKTQLLKNSNTTCLNHQPLPKDLGQQLKTPLKFANDANCFALAESLFGAVQQEVVDAKVVFGVIMGTGVGGGVVVNGSVIGGIHGIGGEWGHNFLDESGGACYCGKVGCVERIISGTALEKFYAEKSGKKRQLKEIVQRYRTGEDIIAKATLNRLFNMFGKGIAAIINVLDPDAIVIGGGLGHIDELYTLGVAEAQKHVFNPVLNTPFLKPKLGDSAGVFGAALL